MAVEDDGEFTGRRADSRQLILEVVVVFGPAIDVGTTTRRSAEAAQV
jgi:hypothetical protein